MLSIISAVDEKIKTVKCKKESKKGCNGKSIKCITHNLWDDLENHINKFFEDNTLNDVLFREFKNNSERIKTMKQQELERNKEYKYGFTN